MARMSEPVSGFDARPDYDPTDHGFTPVTTEEGRLRQLVEYLEEHVPAYTATIDIPWEGSPEEVAAARSRANDRAARLPDHIVHASMLVLGAGVDHTLPFVAYGGASVSFADGVVAGAGHGIPVRVFVPTEPTGAVVVAAHGGAWWMGDGTSRDGAFGPDCAALAQRSGAVVVDVDFRLAPEHPMPAAAEDLAAVVRWVAAQAAAPAGERDVVLADAPIDASKVVLWGRSSGGHACVIAAKLLAGDAGDTSGAVGSGARGQAPQPALVALSAPSLDLRGRTKMMLRAVFGTEDATVPDVSPALGDVSFLGRVYVQTGSADTTVAGGPELVAAVREAGGAAELDEYLATHGVAQPSVQRARITDLARHILAATGTHRELPAEAPGEYDKDAVDRANEESWGPRPTTGD